MKPYVYVESLSDETAVTGPAIQTSSSRGIQLAATFKLEQLISNVSRRSVGFETSGKTAN
jgi:hypothetical protein